MLERCGDLFPYGGGLGDDLAHPDRRADIKGRRAERFAPRLQALPAGLLFLPDELFHKAAALFFPVEQAGGFHAFLPVEPDLIGPGDEPVERVGRKLFAVAGVGQAEKGAQAVRQERAADRRAGKPVVGDVDEKDAGEF